MEFSWFHSINHLPYTSNHMFNPLNTNYTWLRKILAAFHLRVSFSQIYKIKQTKPNPTTTTTTTSYYSRGSSFGDYLLISPLSLSKILCPLSPLSWFGLLSMNFKKKKRLEEVLRRLEGKITKITSSYLGFWLLEP